MTLPPGNEVARTAADSQVFRTGALRRNGCSGVRYEFDK